MPRTIPEWIGKTPDAAIPARVRLRVFEQAGGRCYLCTRRLGSGGEAWDCDHKRPLWDGGEHRESNLAPACSTCHRGKTSSEAAQRAEGRRHKRKAAGIKTTRNPIRGWRKFNGELVWKDAPND